MPSKTPRSLTNFCRDVLPQIHKETKGRRVLDTVVAVQESDCWNSFDRFKDTTRTLVREYGEGGAQTEVFEMPTGGRIGSGRWIIHEAADVRSATLDIVQPVRKRVLDYRDNPWHIIQWGTSTPKGGLDGELMIVDTKEALERIGPGQLNGKFVLTSLDPRNLINGLAERGATVVISDRKITNNPQATAWSKFGWGGIPIENAAIKMVGFVLSANEGKKLRKLHEQHVSLKLHAKVDIRKYAGSHDVVSGIIQGGDDPQDEVWAIAHSMEPGAIDNASGVAVTVEIARVIESLIASGQLPRPRRSIRLVNAYECYGFFGYLENVSRFQTPIAGVCIDTVGSKPEVCGGLLNWRSTIPMSAGFVDRVGDALIRSTLRIDNAGYRRVLGPFFSTADTLVGDPKYGFPCPWLTTHYQKDQQAWDAYHSSADVPKLLSPRGLAACTASMAGYLYYLADAGSNELVELATSETARSVNLLQKFGRRTPSAVEADYLRQEHKVTIDRLKRWMWGGDRSAVLRHLSDCEMQVREAVERIKRRKRKRSTTRAPVAAKRVPRRTAFLSPTMENTPDPIASRIKKASLAPWALFWADGKRNLAEIASVVSVETESNITIEQVTEFFEAHADLNYVELIEPEKMVTKSQIVSDLKKLGLEPGMDVIVHSSLSKIGHVVGGAEAVVEALLSVIGKKGNLLMPSFNHRVAKVYNPLATPTTNGAIPDAMWRRPEAVRSEEATHPVAAIGPRAEEYCEGHLEIGIWAADSPIGRLIHGGGYILALGVTHNSSTAYHVAEISMPAGCIDQFAFQDRMVGSDGQVRIVPGLAFRSGACPVSPRKLDHSLRGLKMMSEGKVGHADSSLVKAIDLWKVRRQHLKNFCPTCKVKPGLETFTD